MNLRNFFKIKPVKTLYKVWHEETFGKQGASGFNAMEADGARKFANWLDSIYLKSDSELLTRNEEMQ